MISPLQVQLCTFIIRMAVFTRKNSARVLSFDHFYNSLLIRISFQEQTSLLSSVVREVV